VVTAPLRRAWTRSTVALGSHPRAYLPLARWRYPEHLVFGPDTEIVIEGFPRSANSFAVNAFCLAQGRPVHVAHHLHAPAQVMAAGRSGVPAIVLVREPEAAICSYLLWQPHLRVREAVTAYLRFYRPLEGLEEMYVAASFEQVTGDFGEVIDRVNEHYGSSFERFDHTPDNVERCFEEIETNSRGQRHGELVESVVARPSDERRHLKQAVQERFRQQTSDDVRAELAATHRHFAELAG
jgi:hypothetical protein